MPRLPTLDDLGSRPVPVSRRQIATNPRASAIADAAAGLGETIAGIGQRMVEHQDKLNYAAAKSALLKADMTARQELENDPDYETWGTRYAERMKTARDEAAKGIQSRSQRTMFAADADLDITRGGLELGKLADGRRRSARVATLNQSLADLQDVGQDALDDATREVAIKSATDLIQAARDGGDIDAVQAGEMGRKWVQGYVVRQISARVARDDVTGAQAFFDANRGRLDFETEGRLEAQLIDATENRENLTIAEDVVNGFSPLAVPVGGGSFSATRMVEITALSESGNRERDGSGRLITSPKGAQGRMQVMPATARQPGYGIRPWDGKTDEDRSRVGRELLAKLVDRHDGDPAKAWASYNWDSSGKKVDALVRKYGSDWLSHAPAETRDYVRKNMAALGGVHQTPRKGDLNSLYGEVDRLSAERGYSPERREAIKSQVGRLVQRNETLLKRQEDDAFESALAKAEALGANFTNVSMLGDAYYRASVSDRARLRAMAEQNAKPTPIAANGDVVRSLHRMAIDAPDQFANANLALYRPFVTDAEFDELSTSQARTKQQAGQWSPRTGIVNAISWGKAFGGVDVGDGTEKYRVYRYIEARAREYRAETKGKAPSESDYQKWFTEATTEVRTTRSFLGIDALAPDTTRRSQKLLSPNYRALIRRQFRAQFGRDPNEAETEQWFDRMGEQLK